MDNSATLEMNITTEDVIQYLKDHPKFLQQNPEAINLLLSPKSISDKGVADFQSYMIERLKADKQQALEDAQEMLQTARLNMNNQQRIHKAVLRMLEANSFDDFIQSITMDLASLLNVDIATFVVESNGEEIPHVHTSGVRIIPKGTVDKWMEDKSVLMQSEIGGIEAIYGGGATLVQSQILLRIDISMDTPPAILAFGSRDPYMFDEDQAADQILFLARVVERSFRQWLDLK